MNITLTIQKNRKPSQRQPYRVAVYVAATEYREGYLWAEACAYVASRTAALEAQSVMAASFTSAGQVVKVER